MKWLELAKGNLRAYAFDEYCWVCDREPPQRIMEEFVTIDVMRTTPAQRGLNVLNLVFGARSGRFYCFNGSDDRILPLMEEVYFCIDAMSLTFADAAELACHFVFELRSRKFAGLFRKTRKDFPTSLPSHLGNVYQLSDTRRCYIPLLLIRSVGSAMYGNELRELDPLYWSRERFRDTDLEYFDTILGVTMKIPRNVFFPDGLIGELFLMAAVHENSLLLQDIKDRVVAEPCTGSGYLGMLLAGAGAKFVISSDIDCKSIDAAKENVKLAGFQDVIKLKVANGLPRTVDDVAAVVLNPPWIDDPSERLMRLLPKVKQRCMVDVGHQTLYRILKSAAAKIADESAIWFILGAETKPLPERLFFDGTASFIEWSWEITGRRGMTFYRYVKKTPQTV